jgi:hypothetical protein
MQWERVRCLRRAVLAMLSGATDASSALGVAVAMSEIDSGVSPTAAARAKRYDHGA